MLIGTIYATTYQPWGEYDIEPESTTTDSEWDLGFEEGPQEQDYYDRDLDAVETIARDLAFNRCVEYGGRWWSDCDSDVDYRTGETTRRDYLLSDEWKHLADAIEARRVEMVRHRSMAGVY